MDCPNSDPARPGNDHEAAPQPSSPGLTPELRRRAQDRARERLAQMPPSLQAQSPELMQQLMHELAVHQVELEMQNDELRRAQLALEASRARYFDLYDLAPVGYLTANAEGIILEANLYVATLLGVARSALVKRLFSRYIAKAQQDIYYQCRQQVIATGEAQTCEVQVQHSEGATVWVSLSLSAGQELDHAPVLRMILSDISARKLLDEALLQSNLTLHSARLQADQANHAKSDFLSSMSHELRSPLNAILGFAQLIELGTPAPTSGQQASLRQILSGGWYLLELINEILDLSLIESGKLNLSMEPVSLAKEFADCAAMIGPQAQQSGICVSMAALDEPYFVRADRTRLKQVIINLLSNAIKYNRAGGTVDVTCHRASAGRVRISVIDTGEGLSEDKLCQLFQPFNRLGQESGTQEGTGIGLVVCKRLVEMMGGAIGVNSRVGIGSEFWLDLKQASLGQAIADDEAPQPPVAQHDVTLRSLLYVEDNPTNTELVEHLIARRSDLRLLKAGNGSSGVAMARMHQPDVILMDINLPGITGFQALKILQDDDATRHIPVLALSANALPHDVQKGLAAGFLSYLGKPIKLGELMQALDLALAVPKEHP